MNVVDNLSEQAAIEAVLAAPVGQPILVDFDETLLLRNSTEEYLSSLRPRWLAGVVLYLLNVLLSHLPVSGLKKTRDWYRVFICTALFPWSPWLWRRHAGKIARQYENTALINALQKKEIDDITVVSAGYRFIIAPLLTHMSLSNPAIIAAEFSGGRKYLSAGKSSHPIVKSLLAQSVFITDSKADLCELQQARTPVLVRWQSAKYVPALTNTYIPLWYAEKIKRPNQRFLFRSVLQDDFSFWLLASIWTTQWGWQLLGITLLLVSFWAIYEVGYRENDKTGFLHEENPKLSRAFFNQDLREAHYLPWVFALISGYSGIAALYQLDTNLQDPNWFVLSCIIWTGILAATRGVYYIYNRLPVRQRAFLYPVLQLFRNFSFTALVPITPGGIALLAANALSSSITYFIYRFKKGRSWPDLPVASLRLLFVSLALIPITLVGSLTDSPNALAYLFITAWCIYRSKQDWRTLIKRLPRKDSIKL